MLADPTGGQNGGMGAGGGGGGGGGGLPGLGAAADRLYMRQSPRVKDNFNGTRWCSRYICIYAWRR